MRIALLTLAVACGGASPAELSADLDAVRDDLADLQAAHDALRAELDALRDDVSDHDGRLDDLDDAVAGLGVAAVVRTQTFGATPAHTHVVFRVDCEDGEVATGGGAGFDGNVSAEEVQQSYPVNDLGVAAIAGETPVGWVSILKNNSASPMTGTGYAVCARLGR